MLRRILAYHLTGLLLLTQVGIPVFAHVCNGRGKAWVSAFVQAKKCCSKRTEATMACKPPASPTQNGIQKPPCCREHAQVIKMKADFTSVSLTKMLKHASDVFQALPLALVAFDGRSTLHQSFGSFQPHAPPLPRYGRSLLVFEQNFRC